MFKETTHYPFSNDFESKSELAAALTYSLSLLATLPDQKGLFSQKF